MPINKQLLKQGFFKSEQEQREFNGLYGIDIWWPIEHKVLNMVWNAFDGSRSIVSFRRGL
jgi:hypothetical protein